VKIPITSHRRRTIASGLLLFIVVTFALFIGAVSIYHLLKWAKKCSNGETILRPGFTNEDSVEITPNNPNTITGIQFIDPVIWFAQDPGTNIMTIPSALPAASRAKNEITMLLSEGNVHLSIRPCVDSSTTVSFAQLGVPVDPWGMPEDLTYQSGTIPSGPFETWELVRSTNGLDWERVIAERLYPNLLSTFQDEPCAELMFYRARKIP
jgi:hypothetical protein